MWFPTHQHMPSPQPQGKFTVSDRWRLGQTSGRLGDVLLCSPPFCLPDIRRRQQGLSYVFFGCYDCIKGRRLDRCPVSKSGSWREWWPFPQWATRGRRHQSPNLEGTRLVPLVTCFFKVEQVANFLVIPPCHIQAEYLSKIIFPEVRMH